MCARARARTRSHNLLSGNVAVHYVVGVNASKILLDVFITQSHHIKPSFMVAFQSASGIKQRCAQEI